MGYVNANDVCHSTLTTLVVAALEQFPHHGDIFTDPYVDGCLIITEMFADLLQFDQWFRHLCRVYSVTLGEVAGDICMQHLSQPLVITHRGIDISLRQCYASTWALSPSFLAKLHSAVMVTTLLCQRQHIPAEAYKIVERAVGSITYVDYALAERSLQRPCTHLTRFICLLRRRQNGLLAARHKRMMRHCLKELSVALLRASRTFSLTACTTPMVYSVSDASDAGWSLALFTDSCAFLFRLDWRETQPIASRLNDWQRFCTSSPLSWHINIKELFPVAFASAILAFLQFRGLWCPILDSSVACGALRRRYSPSPTISQATTSIRSMAQIPIFPGWIPSETNPMDATSRTEHASLRLAVSECHSLLRTVSWYTCWDLLEPHSGLGGVTRREADDVWALFPQSLAMLTRDMTTYRCCVVPTV
jgi:hypothetical protein